MIRRAALLIMLALAGSAGAQPTGAQPAALDQSPLVFDLSSHLIAIRTDFAGAEMLLYGATLGEGDVVVVLRGPELETVVRRKERIAGIWVNTSRMSFHGAPAFYHVAASRPLVEIASAATLARHLIGIGNLRLNSSADDNAAETAAFRAGLVRNKQRLGRFSTELGEVAFLGSRLFRTRVMLPANLPAGGYTAEVFLFVKGQAVAAQTTPMFVSKSGISAEVFNFAYREGAIYGLAVVVFALLAGWAAGTGFRRA